MIKVGLGMDLGTNQIVDALVGPLYDISTVTMNTGSDAGHWWFKDSAGQCLTE